VYRIRHKTPAAGRANPEPDTLQGRLPEVFRRMVTLAPGDSFLGHCYPHHHQHTMPSINAPQPVARLFSIARQPHIATVPHGIAQIGFYERLFRPRISMRFIPNELGCSQLILCQSEVPVGNVCYRRVRFF